MSCSIRVYCSWFWVVLVGFVGFVDGFGWFWLVLLVVLAGFVGVFGWFWLVPCFSNYVVLGTKVRLLSRHLAAAFYVYQ